MLRKIIITFSILYSCISIAKPSYQIDLILFAHPQNSNRSAELDTHIPLIPVSPKAIPLTTTAKSYSHYSLLPPSQSGLKDHYYLLTRKSRYQVLGRYSWRQPANNTSVVALPNLDQHGWQMQGTVQVKQSNYYLFTTKLQFSPPSNPDATFTVNQTQRLKGNTVYYLDHSQIGMIVEIHKIV